MNQKRLRITVLEAGRRRNSMGIKVQNEVTNDTIYVMKTEDNASTIILILKLT